MRIIRSVIVLAGCVLIFGAFSESRAQYMLTFYPGISLPVKGIQGIVNPINPSASFSVYRFTKQLPIALGVTVGLDSYSSLPERLGSTHTLDLLTVPLLLGFRYELLPEFVLRPYYGAEAGILWFRYRFFQPDKTSNGEASGVAVAFVPKVGFRFELMEDFLLELSLRYQLAFHDPIQYGPGEIINIQQLSTLGIQLGISFPIVGRYR